MPPDPDRPVSWITGAAGGIGRATASRLAAAGFAVFATDIRAGGEQDDDVHWHPCDVTSEASVADAVAECRRTHGRLDAVIHLAGRVGRGRLVDTSLEDWRALLDVNLTSAFLIARAGHALLAESPMGCLVLVSSTNGINGGSALSGPAYAAAKAGLINLTRYLAREWSADGIRVNCVAPGPVDTPMLERLDARTIESLVAATPLGRLATADDVAGSIAYLCSKAAGFLTGTVHNVSGGMVLD